MEMRKRKTGECEERKRRSRQNLGRKERKEGKKERDRKLWRREKGMSILTFNHWTSSGSISMATGPWSPGLLPAGLVLS